MNELTTRSILSNCHVSGDSVCDHTALELDIEPAALHALLDRFHAGGLPVPDARTLLPASLETGPETHIWAEKFAEWMGREGAGTEDPLDLLRRFVRAVIASGVKVTAFAVWRTGFDHWRTIPSEAQLALIDRLHALPSHVVLEERSGFDGQTWVNRPAELVEVK